MVYKFQFLLQIILIEYEIDYLERSFHLYMFLIWINIKENKEVFEEEKSFRQLFINIPKQHSSKLSEQVQQELKRERFLNKIKKSTAIAACFFVISFVYIFYFKDNYSQNIYSQNMIMQIL
ncbi:hypothetical protein ACNSOP_03955 [Aliarcobacter lanthieri]|uniref:hypothetical protein n=1 Tax=Aliarcobacter lanthieri TaxID=1355374 RepID=UPI003AA97AB3